MLKNKIKNNTEMTIYKMVYLPMLERWTVLTLSIANSIPSVIRVIMVASKVFKHNCDTG
jgi:hypothetical protein